MMSPPAKTPAAGQEKHTVAVSAAFRVQLNPFYQAYLEAAIALAHDDLAAARRALEKIPPAVRAVDTASLDEMGKKHWREQSDRILFAAYEAREGKKREGARRHFAELSAATTGLVEMFGHALPGPLYRVHCPMAVEATGADWLQAAKEVNNPYYGPAMLGCGDLAATYESQAPLEVPATFRGQLATVYDAYLRLQAALADDRLEDAKAAFGRLQASTRTPDTRLLQGVVLHVWQAAQVELSRALEGDLQGADLAGLRERFASVSKTVLGIVDTFGHPGEVTLHRAFCPMAFDGKGAVWLQVGDQVTNPYFGQKMLRCGEIQRDFPPAGVTAAVGGGKEAQHEQ